MPPNIRQVLNDIGITTWVGLIVFFFSVIVLFLVGVFPILYVFGFVCYLVGLAIYEVIVAIYDARVRPLFSFLLGGIVFFIPLFCLLFRQVIIFLAQFLVLRFGFPPHWSKRIDQALGSFFGFLIIAVVWELPGPLTLGPLDDLWVRLSLTIMTLLFLIFTYLTQDFLPKRRLIRGLGSQNDDLRQQAAETLSEMGAEKLADIKPENKQELVEVLRQMGSAAVPALIQLLKDQNSEVRSQATEALGKVGSATVDQVPDLIQLLKDENSEVRLNASKALREIGIEAVPALIQLLNDDSNEVRSQANRSLREIGPATVDQAPALIQLLEDEHHYVRLNAAKALGQIGTEAKPAIPTLSQLLEDQDPYVRSQAAKALGQIEK